MRPCSAQPSGATHRQHRRRCGQIRSAGPSLGRHRRTRFRCVAVQQLSAWLFDVEHQLALTLLRGPISPDPEADIGQHRMGYAIYPHAGDWRAADTVGKALRLPGPCSGSRTSGRAVAPAVPGGICAERGRRYDRPAEDGRGWVVRLYESTGVHAAVTLEFGVEMSAVWTSNILEDRIDALPVEGAYLPPVAAPVPDRDAAARPGGLAGPATGWAGRRPRPSAPGAADFQRFLRDTDS